MGNSIGGGFNINDILLKISGHDNISDIHLSTGEFISFRNSGDIKKIGSTPLGEEEMEVVVKQLMKGNQKAFEKFIAEKDADFSYIGSDGTPYRVNIFFKLGKIGAVLRKINSQSKNLEDLMFTDIAENIKNKILTKGQGLFLVTGPTGSGKSTSLVAMLDYINATRAEHIITIEDPVEFVFKPKKCMISQRAVGHDTWAFSNALKAAMREDPDVILVGEIRDRETAESVLYLAETGHLVFSTLHTPSAAGTINRFISFFPPEIQDSIADRLSEILIGVQSQRLVKRKEYNDKDGNKKSGRIGVYEILINTSAVKNNIKKRQIGQIDNIMETGIKQGMITLETYAKKLIESGMVNEESVGWILNAKSNNSI